MIILDTNIISEMMKVLPSQKVLLWLDQEEITELYITSITIAEIAYGINALPKGSRKNLFKDFFNKVVIDSFKYRHLFFDSAAAELYGKIMGHRKQLGRPLSILDGQIASIALTHGATLATRNIRDFSDLDLDLINPFK